MRRVFGLASGVYALGITVRLLRRRSGTARVGPAPAVVARPAPAPHALRQHEDAHARPLDAPSVPEPRTEEAHALQVSEAVDSTEGESGSSIPEHVILPARSELDRLPRERLFEIAHATGHRLENLITMSRDDLIDAVARPSGAREERQAPDDPDMNEQAG